MQQTHIFLYKFKRKQFCFEVCAIFWCLRYFFGKTLYFLLELFEWKLEIKYYFYVYTSLNSLNFPCISGYISSCTTTDIIKQASTITGKVS